VRCTLTLPNFRGVPPDCFTVWGRSGRSQGVRSMDVITPSSRPRGAQHPPRRNCRNCKRKYNDGNGSFHFAKVLAWNCKREALVERLKFRSLNGNFFSFAKILSYLCLSTLNHASILFCSREKWLIPNEKNKQKTTKQNTSNKQTNKQNKTQESSFLDK